MQNHTDGPDPLHINVQKAYELRYWAHTFGCTTDELLAAVNKVGNQTQVVQSYLLKKKPPSNDIFSFMVNWINTTSKRVL